MDRRLWGSGQRRGMEEMVEKGGFSVGEKGSL